MIDTHAHLSDRRLHPIAAEVVERAAAAGVTRIVSLATRPDDQGTVLELADRFPGVVLATAGIHPHYTAEADGEALARVRALLDDPRVVAVGETGLDYHYDFSPRERQRESFLRHLEMSRETGKPVVVHAREADDDLRALLREGGAGTVGVLHSFSGGEALLEDALAMGWYVGFSGMVTFKRFEGEAAVRRVPADRLLVETDSPYLAPVPHRGKTNEPGFVVLVARRCAELRHEEPTAFAARVTRNAERFYRL